MALFAHFGDPPLSLFSTSHQLTNNLTWLQIVFNKFWTNKIHKDMQATLDEQHSADRLSSNYNFGGSPKVTLCFVCLFVWWFRLTLEVRKYWYWLIYCLMSLMMNASSTISPSTVWERPCHNIKWPWVANADISVFLFLCVVADTFHTYCHKVPLSVHRLLWTIDDIHVALA